MMGKEFILKGIKCREIIKPDLLAGYTNVHYEYRKNGHWENDHRRIFSKAILRRHLYYINL